MSKITKRKKNDFSVFVVFDASGKKTPAKKNWAGKKSLFWREF